MLEEAQDDATIVAVRDMEEAGVDIVTDGEMRRESYSNSFATALEGSTSTTPAPRSTAPAIRTWCRAWSGRSGAAARRGARRTASCEPHTTRAIRMTVPGPFTMSQQAQNDHYPDLRALALAYAEAVNDELRDLSDAGADVVQIDEPYLQARPDDAREYALEAIERAFDGVGGTKALHTCFGYAAIVHDKPDGYPFLAELDACPADQISIEAAQPRLDPAVLEQLPSKRVDPRSPRPRRHRTSRAARSSRNGSGQRFATSIPNACSSAPDCGMKYLPREVARGKLRALVDGAALARAEL